MAAAARLDNVSDALGTGEELNAVRMLIEALRSVVVAARAERRAA